MTSNIISKEFNNNVPFPSEKNVRNNDLVHKYHIVSRRRYIKREQIKEIAEKKYKENGMGITFEDLITILGVSKRKAQRTLKHHCEENFLFTAQDLEKQGIKLKGFQRKKPQMYYLIDMKAKIIEDNKKNVQKYTTGVGPSQGPSSFLTTRDQMKASNLQEILLRLSSSILYIHKLQIWTCIASNYYDEIDIKPDDPVNKAKIYEARIDQAHGCPNVKFIISPNGTVMIYIINSEHPFRLYTEQDVSDILVFLGRVQEMLSNLFLDTRGIIVQPVRTWILKECDVNKDIEIDGLAQITLPDMQIPLFERVLRGYVKSMDGKAYYRFELALAPNQPIEMALDKIRKEVVIDERILSLEQANEIV